MINQNEFILNKIESAVLNEDKASYTKSEIDEMIQTTIEDYEYEYGTKDEPNNETFAQVESLLSNMNITIN